MKDLLLISNSKTRAEPTFLGYCQREIQEHFGAVTEVLFVPYAEPSAIDGLVLARQRAERQEELTLPTSVERLDAYTEYMRPIFGRMGYKLVGIHEAKNPVTAIENAQALYVGGGNTFDLLSALQQRHLVDPLRVRIERGMPYMGVSAGTVIAGMNLCSSNDNALPLPDMDALEAVPFNIKPHYLDKVVLDDPALRAMLEASAPDVLAFLDHQGESHKDRIMEFHHHFPYVVVGLREGSMLKVEGDHVKLLGTSGARVFKQKELVNGYEPAEEFKPGDSLDFLCSEKVKKVSSASVANAVYLEWLGSLTPLERSMYLMGY